MTTDVNQFLLGSGIKSFSFDNVGDTAKGIIESLDMQQQRDFQTKEPLWWDKEKTRPMMQLRVVLLTDLREDDTDDGKRAVYVKKQMQQAVRDAIKKAGADSIEEGGTLAIKFDHEDPPPSKGLNKTKIYTAAYKPPVEDEQPAAVAVDDLI